MILGQTSLLFHIYTMTAIKYSALSYEVPVLTNEGGGRKEGGRGREGETEHISYFTVQDLVQWENSNISDIKNSSTEALP